MNLAAWVERNGLRLRDEPALAEGERVHLTWAAFAARTAAAAAGLRDDFSRAPGDRVAIVLRNRPEYLEAQFAIWHAGLVAVPVNARLHRDEIARESPSSPTPAGRTREGGGRSARAVLCPGPELRRSGCATAG